MLELIKKKWFQVSVVLFLPFLAYLSILNNNFVWDDVVFIKGWDIPRHFSNFLRFIDGTAPIGFEGVYRPVKIVILSLNLHLFGYSNALMFHFQGIVLHLVITLLTFFIVKKLTKESILALITALLFGLAPVHTEAVAFATASLDLFGILFVLISYLFFLYFRESNSSKFLTLSILFASLAYFSNEITFPFFALLLITDHFIFKRKIKFNKQSLIYIWYLLPVLAYFLIRIIFLHNIVPRRLPTDLLSTMIIMGKVVVHYARVLIFPLDLNAFPNFFPRIIGLHEIAQAEKEQVSIDLIVGLGFLIIGLLIFLGVYFRKKHPIVSFSIFWILISFVPFSNIFPIGAYYAERYLYLASLGFYLGVGYLFFYLLNLKTITRNRKKIVIFILLITLLLYFVRVVSRNNDWQNNVTLWQRALVQSPKDPDVHNNLGLAYLETGDIKSASIAFDKAIKIDPSNPAYPHNLSLAYYRGGDSTSALSYLKKAHNLDKANELYAIGLAQFYYDYKYYSDLEDLIKTVSFKEYKYMESFFKGSINLDKGKLSLAKKELEKSIRIKGDSPWAYNELASVYIKENNLTEAEKLANKAIQTDSSFPNAYNNLAIIYIEREDLVKALSFIDKALLLNPNYTDAQVTKEKIQTQLQQDLLQFLQQP